MVAGSRGTPKHGAGRFFSPSIAAILAFVFQRVIDSHGETPPGPSSSSCNAMASHIHFEFASERSFSMHKALHWPWVVEGDWGSWVDFSEGAGCSDDFWSGNRYTFAPEPNHSHVEMIENIQKKCDAQARNLVLPGGMAFPRRLIVGAMRSAALGFRTFEFGCVSKICV